MENQKQVWDNIAEEWNTFKEIPAEHVKKFLENASGKVLDLGSGSGRNLMKIKNGKMYLVDFSEKMIELAREKAKSKNIEADFVVGDLTKIPFENNFFDFAICISALHCIEGEFNRKKVAEEIFRVLKKGGKAEIGVWNFQSKRFNQKKGKEKKIGWTDKGKRYYYLFDEKEIHELFEKVGFKILSTNNSEMMINFVVEK